MASGIRRLNTKGRFDLLKTVHTLLVTLGIKALASNTFNFEYRERDRICIFTLLGSNDTSIQVIYRPEIDANTSSELTITVYGNRVSREPVLIEVYNGKRLTYAENNDFNELYESVTSIIASALDHKYGADGLREHFGIDRWLKELLRSFTE